MIKSFQIPWDNNTKETVEYEDDITFGELEGILNQCLDVTQIQDPKVNLPLYRQLILTTVIRKAPFEVRDTAAIKNLRSSVAKTIMTEVMKDYPLAKYLEEWVRIHSFSRKCLLFLRKGIPLDERPSRLPKYRIP